MKIEIVLLRLMYVAISIILTQPAFAQPDLTEDENNRSKEWLENNRENSNAPALLRALLSLHYEPSVPLAQYLSADLNADTDRYVLNAMIYQCGLAEQLDYCQTSEIYEQLTAIDPHNITPYLQQFNHFVANRDFDNALVALQNGLATPNTNDYYFEKVMVLRQELPQLGFFDNRANYAAEFYSLNGLTDLYTKIIPTCLEVAPASQEWESVCLRIGRRLEQGTSFFANVYGAAIQRDVVAATSTDEEEIEAALKNRDFYSVFRVNAREALDWWTIPDARPNSFYENASRFGEFRATELEIIDSQ
ncbi:MAG: hypothetical protein MI746_08020 [Pseudomonadales bacterium]|nr:hypothetical protein [Pseudomonadales bacterium]